ncbi:glycosyltransferase family 2 protein [Winogradskyella immobilis]|uniref:Glycosyltransferase family 2 protein n=1 Tax=Winogradskyella immobilis TaxID=2816852 RepID=A0ABS8EPH8_9FLAO|nr:glycosyltransferase family 2 protein [Winogradskyella immobilis]MCC1484911.1 glycosyltransferase family 2 protein [Winogradskyella immobilis]MCG0017003.1 glycosyltransferase family 2 protein [Winogradskyella immobilis]
MKEQPLVSIIIPTYNRAHLIGETLDSILAQTYTNWECIVVDDDSTDHTDKVLAKYCVKDTRFQYFHRPKDRLPGGNAARNYGFELSKGYYIQWFDDDDIMLPNYLSSRMSVIDTSTNLCMLSGKLVDEYKNDIRDLKWFNDDTLYRQYVLKLSEILSPSVLFKRQFLNKKVLFNEALFRSQEAEFFSRVFFNLNTSEYKQIPEIGFLYRQHQQTKSFTDNTYNSGYKKAHFLVHQTNWNQAIIIKDKEIIKYCYKKIIILLFETIRAKDTMLFKEILRYLKKHVKPLLFFKIKSSLYLILWTNTQGYKFKPYLLNQNL